MGSGVSHDWYIAPLIEQQIILDWTDPDDPVLIQEGYLGPATGNPLVPAPQPSMVCYAYSTDQGTVLAGLPVNAPAPSDWTPQTVEEARAHYTEIEGHPPPPGEID